MLSGHSDEPCIARIKLLRNISWEVIFKHKHNYREGNTCADWLAESEFV